MSLMIDWVSVSVPMPHYEPINSGNVVSVDREGNIEWLTTKRLAVEGSYGSTIQVRSDYDYNGAYTNVRLDGNLIKFMQGHNVFGSNDLSGLITSVLLKLIPNVIPDTAFSVDILPDLVNCAKLTRVDITGMYDLGNQKRVLAWLRAAADSSNLSHRGRGQFSGDTLYWGKKSRRWALKAYPKGKELQAHKPAKGIIKHPHYLSSITDFADKALRFELVLRSMELERINLSSVSLWKKGTEEEVYNRYVSRLEFSQNMKVVAEIPDFEKLPSRLTIPLRLWYRGDDLREFYSRAAWYRYRKEIKDLIGLDVALPPPVKQPEPSHVIPLITFLEAKPMGVPEWAKGTPLYFEPPTFPVRGHLYKLVSA